MPVIAHARNIHMSPRKVRLVAGLVRGMDAEKAVVQLRFLTKAAATPVRKLIDSAIANAVHNFKLSPETLYVKAITVDGGPVLKRWRARAFGRAADIKKRSSHISVTLESRGSVAGTPKGIASAKVASSDTSTEQAGTKKPRAQKGAAKKAS